MFTRLLRRLGPMRWFRALTSRFLTPIDNLVYRVTGGRRHLTPRSLPMARLTTTGRRSGQPRTVPVFAFPTESGHLLVATNFGKEQHPGWSANLLADPTATLEIDGSIEVCRARLLSEEELAGHWPRIVEAWPAYATYREVTSRTVRAFALAPAE